MSPAIVYLFSYCVNHYPDSPIDVIASSGRGVLEQKATRSNPNPEAERLSSSRGYPFRLDDAHSPLAQIREGKRESISCPF